MHIHFSCVLVLASQMLLVALHPTFQKFVQLLEPLSIADFGKLVYNPSTVFKETSPQIANMGWSSLVLHFSHDLYAFKLVSTSKRLLASN